MSYAGLGRHGGGGHHGGGHRHRGGGGRGFRGGWGGGRGFWGGYPGYHIGYTYDDLCSRCYGLPPRAYARCMTLANCWPMAGLGAEDGSGTQQSEYGPARIASQGSSTYTPTSTYALWGAGALGFVAVLGVGSALFFGRRR